MMAVVAEPVVAMRSIKSSRKNWLQRIVFADGYIVDRRVDCMSDFNGKTYLLSAIYHTRGSFSHLPRFLKQVIPYFCSLPYERAPVLEKVRQLRQEYATFQVPITQEEALKLMISRDLQAIEQVLLDDAIARSIDQRQDMSVVLRRVRDKAVDLLQSMGVQIEPPEIVFVTELPFPYNQRGYSAFTADQGDKEKYHMHPGIYFPIKRLRPFYSEFLLVHEMIHAILGKTDPYLLARGLEEGLAELIGSMYLSSRILGKELTINLFIYNRLSSDHQRFWESYLDATRMALLLHQRAGLQGILTLLTQGRRRLKQIEDYCLQMEFDKIDLPQGKTDPELTTIADFLTLAFQRNLVVSPLAKYLASYVQPGYTLKQILQDAQVEKDAGLNALSELENGVNLASYSSESDKSDARIVNWSDCDRLSRGSTIRYEITT
jgi:hypothetical protein